MQFFNHAFQIKSAHKNFKVLVLKYEVEISHQHNITIFTCQLVQDKRQIVTEILIIWRWRFIETNTKPFLSFYAKLNKNYFGVIGLLFLQLSGYFGVIGLSFLQLSSRLKNLQGISSLILSMTTIMFVSVPSIQLISMDPKSLIRKCFIYYCFRQKHLSTLFHINSCRATVRLLIRQGINIQMTYYKVLQHSWGLVTWESSNAICFTYMNSSGSISCGKDFYEINYE